MYIGSVSLFPFIFLVDYALDSAELDSICHLSAAFNEPKERQNIPKLQ